jgi:hypothetical protein
MTKISNQYSLTNILTADLANSRLGINNVSPAYSLDLTGTARVSGAATFSSSVTASDLIISDTYANDPLIKLASTTSGNVEVQMRTASTTYNAGIGVVTSGYDFNFFTANSTRMTITSAGNVGINGTPTDYGSGSKTLSIVHTGTSGNPFFDLYYNGDRKGYLAATAADFYIATPNPDIGIIFETAGNARLKVHGYGNVSIGTTTDNGYKLYVSGTIYATGNITANSDLTLKKNLELITNPTDKLMQLNGYAYQWKEDDSHQYGVIAQEVEKILPYAVSTGNDGIKGVSYNQIIPVLIEAVKELSLEINLLKQK